MLAGSRASMAACMDVRNEIDRWRIQRRRVDARHTRVVGEEGQREREMRDAL